jgi:hypothetical protein
MTEMHQTNKTQRNIIEWSPEKGNPDNQFIRRQIVDAHLAYLLYKYHTALSPNELKFITHYSNALVRIAPALRKHEYLAHILKELVNAATYATAERSTVKLENAFSVSYDDKVKGIMAIRLSRAEIRKLSTGKLRGGGYGLDTLASKSYGLLVGEWYQYAAKRILHSTHISGYKVIRVTVPPKLPRNKGRRIDDWMVTLSNGRRVPVEVKSSTRSKYFESAFCQAKNTLNNCPSYPYALFVGFHVSIQRVLVVLVTRTDSLSTFRARVKRMLSGFGGENG